MRDQENREKLIAQPTIKQIYTPLSDSVVSQLNAGDNVLISGTIYTARDQAHQRLIETIKKGEILPFDLRGQIIFYAGPAPTPPGKVSGAIGPTTSARMDSFILTLLEYGLKGTLGKGPRSAKVKEALIKHNAVYFAATGGVAALLSSFIKKSELLAYPDLGPEGIYKLEIEKFPAIVAIDAWGRDLYEENRQIYRQA